MSALDICMIILTTTISLICCGGIAREIIKTIKDTKKKGR